MGGSMALALKEVNNDLKLFGLDKNENNLNYLMGKKIINKIINNKNISQLDILFIAVPVRSVITVITDLLPYLDIEKTLVSDMGSTKAFICKQIKEKFPELNFIGGHPMTGKELSGPQNATADLFKGRTYVLIEELDDVFIKKRELLINLLEDIGANIVSMDAQRHDEIVSLTSHLPHLLAAAIVNQLSDCEENYSEITKIMGQGYRDFTRIAACNPEMWQDIFLTNKETILDKYEGLIEQMNIFKEALENDDEDLIFDLMSAAQAKRLSLDE